MSVSQSKCLQDLLPVLCVLIVLAASQEHYLSYDNATRRLHFRCPLDSDLINNKLIVATFGRYNQRTTSGQVSRLANWYNNSATKYEHTGKVVLTTRQSGLKGYLTDVRCEDSLTYYCSYHFSESNWRISTRLDNFTFTFEGPSNVSMERPQNVHPCPGDKMEVTCRAFLGRQTNSIVWESRPPDGQFVLDTDSDINYSVMFLSERSVCNHDYITDQPFAAIRKRKSHENPVTYQEMGTIRAHNDYSQTPANNSKLTIESPISPTAASHLELHPSPIPFDDVVGDDWYAKASKTTA
ncbi:hypothetical protein C0Q70_05080 [Pomacea canaliculata]|uniref:Ig-like domain-containing protein n=1 Tax=Pomacea canaliculata TaxID=400727 RepID=A0A2T7PK58_POMCA|nr:hypothetical protein C0Q70_05080 [Pomacea canaliculata]